MIGTKIKSCSNARKNDICLSDLVFSWSIKDVLNKDLFKGQVKQIPQKFASNANYLSSFKHPLIEETRADFCCGLESVAQAPSCEIASIKFGNRYKPPKSLYYEISTKFIEEDYPECSGGGRYEPESGDLFVVTTMRPRRVNDVIRPGEPFWVAKVVFASEEHPTITIFSSQEFDFDLLDKKRHNRLFATYLMNLTTNMRIWAALNPDPQSANLGLIHTVLHYDPAVDDGCTQCLLEGDANVNGWNILDFVGSLGLDESQKKAVLSSIRMRKCTHQKHKVKLIWGPPGTGKTKTVSCLLFALLKLNCRTLTCAPTNTAVLQVAERLVRVFLDQSLEHDAYGLGDIVLFGNKKRMNINDHDELDDVFLEYRCEILAECFKPFTGWKYTLEMMISLLKDPQKQYKDYLENGKKDDGDENDSGKGNNENEFGSDESSIKDKNRKGSKKGNKKHFKEVINQQLRENKKNDSKKGKKKKNQANPSEEHASDDAHNKGNKNPEFETETQDLLTCEEYVAKIFYSNACRLTSIANDLYTHLPTTLLPLCAAKCMMILVHLLNMSLENPTKRFGDFALLMIKRENILSILNSLHKQFSGLDTKLIELNINLSDLYLELQFWNLCLSYARLIFCTASSSVKVRSMIEMVVIDEAAQLKECESAIPFQIPGLRNAILIGDDRQLPAMVRSKASKDANFGRSLFQRLATLGKKKHLLNIQYRMHPSISIFPNKVFYENKIVDGPNVKQQSYTKSFTKGDMYGSYCFINVAEGKENFDKGYSPRNVEEAAVVDRIIAKLFKGHCITKQKVSVGVISPYKGQVCQIQETLRKKYDQFKQKGFSVSVRSVDGFQGGEEDIIIISTARSNRTGSVGFLYNHQRTNVALTRARYCLWIVGHGTTLINSGTVWKNLVIDAKIRGCFYSSEECKDLPQVSMTQSYSKFDYDFLLTLCKAKWKVVFTDKFQASIASLKSNTINKQVTDILKKLAEGWHQPNTLKSEAGSINGMASKLLEQYKINEHLCLAWTVDILKEESQYTQVIKVWDILLVSQIKKLVKELNILYETYTVDFVNLCKHKSIDGFLVVPMSWPLYSIGSNLSANQVDCLAGQLAAIDLRDNQGESSSRFRGGIRSATLSRGTNMDNSP